jgi:hypothetical protein
MAGQPDAADDLIAELAKLMAQDSKDDRPATETPFSVRIPGVEPSQPASSTPRFDFSVQPSRDEGAASMPLQGQGGSASPVPNNSASASSSNTPREPAEPAPEPFHFDFQLGSGQRQPEPPPSPRAAAPAFEPPAPAPRVPSPPQAPVQAATPPPPAEQRDSIADLIAGELGLEAEAPEQRFEPMPVADPVPNLELRPSMERANPQAPAPTENDRFTVPPVFGVAPQRPAAAQPAAPASPVPAPPQRPVSQEPRFAPQPPVQRPNEPTASGDDDFGRDPIDEIESLIGSAMRVELDAPRERAPAPTPAPTPKREPSPALRSLATPTLATPKPSAPRNLSSVDEAVFAAAQASGAEIDWVHAPETTSRPEPVARVRRRAPRVGVSRAVAGPLVALLLLGVAGGGLYWALGLDSDDGPAPLLTADATPIKETPAAQPDTTGSQSIIFNEMDGVTPGENEQLVSRDQTNLSEMANIPTPDVSEEGLANRKVRTVTVRPDGTIVSSAEGVAGSSILPVDRPNVPVVPGATDGISELLANVEATTPAATLTPPTPTATPAPAATPTPEPTTAAATPAAVPEVTLTPAQPGSVVPAVDAAGSPIPGKTAIVPRTKPATFPPQTIAAAPAATAPLNAVIAPPTQAAGIPGAREVAALPNSAPAYVQLASQRSEADARQTAQALVARFGPLFGGASMEVQRVDLGERGIYFRVRVPASSLQEANTLCNNIKAAGGDCFTM